MLELDPDGGYRGPSDLVVFAYPKSLALGVVCLKKRNTILGCLMLSQKTEYHGIARNVRIAMLKMLSKP